MKTILTTTICTALLTFVCVAADENKPLTERAKDTTNSVIDKTKEVASDTKDAVVDAARNVGEATRTTWIKTKGYLSEDAVTYREGATQTLNELSGEITQLKAMVPAPHPEYFKTRIQALEQHHQQLSMDLAKLTPDDIKTRMSGMRHAFDQSLESLEEAINQAHKEAKRLGKKDNV